MRVHPEIAALRGDDTPQREAQAALSAVQALWSELPQTKAVMADLARFADARLSDAGVAIEDCPALFDLFRRGAAQGWVGKLMAGLTAGLREARLGHVPLRHFTNGVTSSLLLGRVGETTLALAAMDGVALAKAAQGSSVSFAPLESHELVLAGAGEAEIIDCEQVGASKAPLRRQKLRLEPGVVISREGGRRAMRLLGVESCLVTLRLQRRPRHGGVAFEYDIESGTLLHRAAGVMRESRHALMINLLGRMGRKDAAPVLADIAQEEAASDLRWQALREGLGLDTATGFAALAKVAARPDDALAKPAAALKAQLLELYPALVEIA